MKTLTEIKNILDGNKSELHQKYGVKELGVFGSYIRGEQQQTSDIDILVCFDKAIGLFKFLELEQYLSDILGIKVDLVTREALKPYIGQNILNEVVYL